MGLALQKQVHLELIECASCGVEFAITAFFQSKRRESHESFYCPNGHSNVYRGKNEAERLRELLEQANRSKTELAADNARITSERDKAQKELSRQRKRSQGGACPCCNRSFVALSRHMKTKHPDYANTP